MTSLVWPSPSIGLLEPWPSRFGLVGKVARCDQALLGLLGWWHQVEVQENDCL